MVDIAVHKVATGNPLQLNELIVSDNVDLGSTKVDDRFFDFIGELVGDKFANLCGTAAFLSLKRNWEDKKICFTVSDTYTKGKWWTYAHGRCFARIRI